jgi:hypothetical protein
MWQVGRAEVEVRVRPAQRDELEWYASHELEAGTEVDYLEVEASRGKVQDRHSMVRAVKAVVRAVLMAFRGRYVEAQ